MLEIKMLFQNEYVDCGFDGQVNCNRHFLPINDIVTIYGMCLQLGTNCRDQI